MHPALHSEEFTLLLNSITADGHQLENINYQVDENRLTDLMHRHRVGPLVYSKLSNSSYFSQNFHAHWRAETLQNQKSAIRVKQFQLEFSRLLVDKKIPHIFLKGITLSEKYYGDLALRHVLDVDLLVPEESIDMVSELLIKFGFRADLKSSSLTPSQKKFLRYVDHDIQFFANRESLPELVELHWKWRGALGGFTIQEVRELDDAELFLYLSVHGTEHGWFRLKWLTDLLMMMRSLKLNWSLVKNRALELQCLSHLEITISVLNTIFGISIPDQFQYIQSQQLHQKKLDHIYRLIASKGGFQADDTNRIHHFVYMLGLSKTKINVRLLLKYCTSPEDWRTLYLPDSLFFLYFPLRPFIWTYRRLRG